MTEKKLIEKLRKQYSENPPEGMTQQDVLHMSDKDLLDMDYFLTEEDDETNRHLKKYAFPGKDPESRQMYQLLMGLRHCGLKTDICSDILTDYLSSVFGCKKSGKRQTLLSVPPLRTERAIFTAFRSRIYNA